MPAEDPGGKSPDWLQPPHICCGNLREIAVPRARVILPGHCPLAVLAPLGVCRAYASAAAKQRATVDRLKCTEEE